MWMGSCAALVVAVIPMYLLIGTSLTGAIIGFAVLGMLYAPQLATISATFPAMFPTIVRFAGVAIGYVVELRAVEYRYPGATAPVLSEVSLVARPGEVTAIIGATGNNLVPAFYMLGACLIGIVSAYFLIETKGLSLRGTEVPGTPESIEEQKKLATQTP